MLGRSSSESGGRAGGAGKTGRGGEEGAGKAVWGEMVEGLGAKPRQLYYTRGAICKMRGLCASGVANSDQRTSWTPVPGLPLTPSIPRLIFGMMVSTAFLSMWLSNTASTAMMLPIASAILKNLFGEEEENAGEAVEKGRATRRWRGEWGYPQGVRAAKGRHSLSTCYVPSILIIVIIVITTEK